MSRVVLVDPGDGLETVRDALREHPDVTVDLADTLPSGTGVVGVLVPPDVPVGGSALAGLPDLRVVAATATGYDHLDLAAISAAGAWATHCPGYCTEEVAEHAIAFALDLLRGVTLLDRSVHAGAWDLHQAAPQRVSGAVLGIIGLGRIGREVARRALALEMRVLGFDPMVSPAQADGIELHELDFVLARADVVTLHALLIPGQAPLIGAAELEAMRPGAYLINCARAGLVNSEALGAALKSGRIGGCALDVLPVEPPPDDQPELRWPRTLINPHAAWYSPAAATEPYRRAGEAVADVLGGREPADALARPALTPR
jgi:D-3-phosphoglycerate dehydrogenase / 2-oxoglutarate reductase